MTVVADKREMTVAAKRLAVQLEGALSSNKPLNLELLRHDLAESLLGLLRENKQLRSQVLELDQELEEVKLKAKDGYEKGFKDGQNNAYVLYDMWE